MSEPLPTIESLGAENRQLRRWNDQLVRWVQDLQSGMYVNCVYCGHRYGPGETTPATMADALKEHVAQCPRHPMSQMVDACLAAYHLSASLLAVREGVTDALIEQTRDAAAEALARIGRHPLGAKPS